MSNYTHPGQHVTALVGRDTIVAYGPQGNPLFTCCGGRAACGGHVNYLPQVGQFARIAAGPAVWRIVEVDEQDRAITLLSVTRVDSDYRAISFENCTVVQCPDICPDCWSDLKSDGYPIGHQDASTGDPCAFTWGDR